MRAGLLLLCVVLAGCGGGSLPARHEPGLPPGVRPIGPGERFRPGLGAQHVQDCRTRLGRRTGVHLELFAQRFVVLFPAGIGTRAPRRLLGGRIDRARCYGPLVTIDPTGLILLRPGTRATVGDVFATWGSRFGAGFRGRVRTWVNGAEHQGPPTEIPLRRHDEIVIEIGGYVPPHAAYTFPAGY